jgi:aspartate ammonia-lyase
VIIIGRLERDSIGSKMVPDEAYYGIQTTRAVENFPVSGIRERREFINAYILLKKAAATANMKLGALDQQKGEAILCACDDVLTERFADQFPVDVFQAGAGTSSNMNVNEVIANRSLEILGHMKGEYEYLSPNDHVNMAQSTNDTFPTASHIAVIGEADRLIINLRELAAHFHKKGDEFLRVQKIGRTHLMDAVEVTLGNEFHAYGVAIDRAAERISQARNGLLEVPLGGTATGTGVNAAAGYRKMVIDELSNLTGLTLLPSRDYFEGLQSRSQLVSYSGAMRELAFELVRIANDLRLLGSGPAAGIGEIVLPTVQPGSSIMAGKVNPVMAECLDMVAFQVIGHDTAVSLAAQAGQLELNVMTPVMTYNILEATAILNAYIPVFGERCIAGITADEVRCRSHIENNPMRATLLVPKIGYIRAAELAKESTASHRSVRKIAVEMGLITEKEADELFGKGK